MHNFSKLLNLDLPVILASRSPRRSKLLSLLGFDFEVIPSDVEENLDTILPPEAFCIHLAWSKAEDVARHLDRECIVLGADTIVVLDDKILNKPVDRNNAIEMLKELSGRTHTVYTGLALIKTGAVRKWKTSYRATKVTFRKLDEEEIVEYVATGSPMDKAGAYGIQDDFGAVFVTDIYGDYYNIVGLPLETLYMMMKTF